MTIRLTSPRPGVALITIDRPEKRNALTDEMLEKLQIAYTTPPAEREKFTVLRGRG